MKTLEQAGRCTEGAGKLESGSELSIKVGTRATEGPSPRRLGGQLQGARDQSAGLSADSAQSRPWRTQREVLELPFFLEPFEPCFFLSCGIGEELEAAGRERSA